MNDTQTSLQLIEQMSQKTNNALPPVIEKGLFESVVKDVKSDIKSIRKTAATILNETTLPKHPLERKKLLPE
jgi:hypothetical protein